jgi:hypothetical protein
MKNSNDTIGNGTRDLLLYVVSSNLETSGTYDGPNESSQHSHITSVQHDPQCQSGLTLWRVRCFCLYHYYCRSCYPSMLQMNPKLTQPRLSFISGVT